MWRSQNQKDRQNVGKGKREPAQRKIRTRRRSRCSRKRRELQSRYRWQGRGQEPAGARRLQQGREKNGDREEEPAGKLQEEAEAHLVISEDLSEEKRRRQCELRTRLED